MFNLKGLHQLEDGSCVFFEIPPGNPQEKQSGLLYQFSSPVFIFMESLLEGCGYQIFAKPSVKVLEHINNHLS